MPIAREAGLVVVSPMRRTCETATLALDWLLAPDEKDGRPPVKAIADALWQGTS